MKQLTHTSHPFIHFKNKIITDNQYFVVENHAKVIIDNTTLGDNLEHYPTRTLLYILGWQL